MTLVCAIHQPNFFPWMGYFDKIYQSDIFVFLDDIQHPKNCGGWINRVKLNSHGKEKWFTCPISRPSGFQKINNVKFADSGWKTDFVNVIDNYYSKYKNFKRTKQILNDILDLTQEVNLLAEFNMMAIQYFSNFLGYDCTFIKKSDLKIDSKSTDMLIDVCKAVGADTYLCGGGASGYQEDQKFELHQINLRYQNFTPEVYGNSSQFIPGLSIIDYLMTI